MAKPYFQPTHKSSRPAWEAAIGQERCPYCGHHQIKRQVNIEPRVPQKDSRNTVDIFCDDCDITRGRICLTVKVQLIGTPA